MASSGTMNSSLENMMVSIVLRNGSLHKPGNDNAQIVQFDQYQINIPLHLPETKATRQKRTALTMAELLVEAHRSDEDIKNKRKDMIEFHKRLVLPVGCLMISLLGLPLGLQARPGKKAIGIQAGLAIFVLYYIFFTFGKTLAENGTLPVWLAMWSPNILFFALAIFWITRVANEQPLFPEMLIVFLKKLLAVFLSPLKVVYQRTLQRLMHHSKKTSFPEEIDTLTTTSTVIKGDVGSMVFHIPACENYNCHQCTLEFKDIGVAREAGFEPCNICKKLINEQPLTTTPKNDS
jgi:lipopolysaccharide export system permease protein